MTSVCLYPPRRPCVGFGPRFRCLWRRDPSHPLVRGRRFPLPPCLVVGSGLAPARLCQNTFPSQRTFGLKSTGSARRVPRHGFLRRSWVC